MFKKFLMLGSIGFLIGSSSVASAAVTSSKAAELAAHRIERLVTQGKIAEEFVTNLAGMTVEIVKHGAAPHGGFKINAYQETDAGQTASVLEMHFDLDGKYMSSEELEGTPASNPTQWNQKDPITLVEESLHYLADLKKDKDTEKFDTELSGLQISQVTIDGQTVAKVTLSSSAVTKKMNIIVSLTGKVLSSEVVE